MRRACSSSSDCRMPDQHRADHFTADEERRTRRDSRARAADAALEQRVVAVRVLVSARLPYRDTCSRRGTVERHLERRVRPDLGDGLEPVLGVVAIEHDHVAVGDGKLEVPLQRAVGFRLVLGELHALGELQLRQVVVALALAAGRHVVERPAEDGELVLTGRFEMTFELPVRDARGERGVSARPRQHAAVEPEHARDAGREGKDENQQQGPSARRERLCGIDVFRVCVDRLARDERPRDLIELGEPLVELRDADVRSDVRVERQTNSTAIACPTSGPAAFRSSAARPLGRPGGGVRPWRGLRRPWARGCRRFVPSVFGTGPDPTGAVRARRGRSRGRHPSPKPCRPTRAGSR